MKIYANGLVSDRHADLPDPRQVVVCRRWLHWFARPRKTINKRCSSYGLKHAVESWAGTYITNGAFLEAAILEGYRVEQIERGPNGFFNMQRVWVH